MSATPEVRYWQHVESGHVNMARLGGGPDGVAERDPIWREVTVTPVSPQGAATPADETALAAQVRADLESAGILAWTNGGTRIVQTVIEYVRARLAASPAGETALHSALRELMAVDHADDPRDPICRAKGFIRTALAASPTDADVAERIAQVLLTLVTNYPPHSPEGTIS